MNKIALKLALSLLLLCGLTGYSQTSEKFFQYPVVPEEKAVLSERCNYLVYHFWERCNLKQSFSWPDKLSEAFGDWVSFMPYATADTVYLAVDKFLEDVNKTGADNMLTIGKIAEQWLYADTAQYMSEELYLPFCKAVAENKKVSKSQKAKFAAQAKIIENSSVNAIAGDFDFVKPDGNKGHFNDVVASRIILFFYDPDCIDCTLTKAKLAADYYLGQLIDKGLVKVIAIYPGDATDEWKAAAAAMPETWTVGASSDVDTLFDIPETPTLYYLDARHKVLAKDVVLENLLLGIEGIYKQMTK